MKDIIDRPLKDIIIGYGFDFKAVFSLEDELAEWVRLDFDDEQDYTNADLTEYIDWCHKNILEIYKLNIHKDRIYESLVELI
jgi:hypothetical protein